MNIKKNSRKIITDVIISIILALLVSCFFTARMWQVNSLKSNLMGMSKWLFFNRAYILAFVFVYAGFHFIFPIKQMYCWIFKNRWYIGLILLAFLTINRYHGDSIGSYDIIQTGSADEAANPILGETRGIRSDEWLVATPSVLASGLGKEAYGKYNNIQRGTKTLNIINGVYVGYSTIAYCPWELVYKILPVEYAFSFCWFSPIIFSFLMVLELFYILTQKNKLLSFTGACLVVLSSFYMWWVFSIYYVAAPGTIVFIYYFLQNEKKWKKSLCCIGMAICFSNFVTNLYPAWQVPLGYVFLVIGLWVLYDNLEKIRNLEKKDWCLLAGGVIFLLSLVSSYFLQISEYVTTINQTVYPGKRMDCGSFYLNKLFYYIQAPLYAYKDIGNPSEAGVFFSLFPIPTVVACYDWFKENKKDWLTGGLILIEIPMLVYTTIGLPQFFAKATLFSHSTVMRVVDIIGLIQIILIIRIMSVYKTRKRIKIVYATIISIAVAGYSLYVTTVSYPGYMKNFEKIIMSIIIFSLAIALMCGKKRKTYYYLISGFIMISIVTSVYVRPVMKGLSAIYSRPVAKKIEEINKSENNPKWIASGVGLIPSGFTVSCGASTVNSVNSYPNMKLWTKLDPKGKYSEVYNRYAHVDVDFTENETSFELLTADHFVLHLSYSDIKKTNVTEVFMIGELMYNPNNGYVKFEKQYDENGVTIYHMSY